MTDASSLGISPASNAATQIGLIYNSVFPSQAAASFVGGLSQNNTGINVLSQLTPLVSKDFYTFNFESGSNIKLAFNATVGALGDANNDTPGSNVDGVSSGLRYQLYDVTGNLIADSAGTPTQQAAYASLTSSTGLSAANGTYNVQVSAAPNTTISTNQNYNFQLYSGTTYATNLVYTAQTQSYDPNLFVSAASTMNPAANLSLYTNTASLSGTQASALGIGNLNADQSELDVTSQVNSQNPAAYYQLNFQQGQSLKFTLNNTTNSVLQTPLRVQLYDSNGNLTADNYGNTAQQRAYAELASGEGLVTANGSYVAKVSYAPNADITQPQSYNFQFNSGSSYGTVYQTTASQPSAIDPGASPNVGIFADSQAQLYTAQQYHAIGETASTGVEIGWLQENQSRLDVQSQLTTADTSDFYTMTLQQGQNLKLAYDNTTNTAATRIQLLDASGTQVLADNYGTDAQKQAFSQLTSTTGLAATPSDYVVQVSYAPNADTSQTQTYNFQVYSGSTFTNSYQTLASSQTYQNAILSGNPAVVGYNSATAIASYLNNLSTGDSNPNIIDTLSSIA